MAYYYENLDKKLIDNQIKDIGRLCHEMRNDLQGYINLNKPQILTLDNISAQIEGHVRSVRGQVFKNEDI